LRSRKEIEDKSNQWDGKFPAREDPRLMYILEVLLDIRELLRISLDEERAERRRLGK
jgi:hypothetical protein